MMNILKALLILIPLSAGAYVLFELWIRLVSMDWHQEQERKLKQLLRPVHGTKEEIEHGLSMGEYIICGNEIHLAEAHFPTKNPEYPLAFKVAWKRDRFLKRILNKR